MQTFNGIRYYRDGKTGYFRTGNGPGPRDHMHVDIWRFHHGNIPHGWNVHHHDEDRSNNDYANLQALAPRDHKRIHNMSGFWAVCEECGAIHQTSGNRFCNRKCAGKHLSRQRRLKGR
jgi:hypothetical protein